MNKVYRLIAGVLIIIFCSLLGSCGNNQQNKNDLTFTILQLNDVYEIGPVSGGKEGGMARVATIRQELLDSDANTLTVLAGDFVSPSLLGTLQFRDSTAGDSVIAGKQMIEVMNATGVDLVTFGNHEFDIKEPRLQARINESEFSWVSCNVLHKTIAGNVPYVKTRNNISDTIKPWLIRKIVVGSDTVRLGIIGATLNSNKADYVAYDDVNSSVKNAYEKIKDKCDIVIAVTHLSVDMDSSLAVAVPGLSLIIGGHEHVKSTETVGKVVICKADANAKSVYIHKVTFNKATRQVTVKSEVKMVGENIAAKPDVDAVVKKWVKIGNESLAKSGYNPDSVLLTLPAGQKLNGKDEDTRTSSTNLTRLIANSLIYYYPDTTIDLAMYNSGSIRLDDDLAGQIKVYDVLRTLPFGDLNVLMNLKGAMLKDIIRIGLTTNKNSGGYLQFYYLTGGENGPWLIKGKPIDDAKQYKVLLPSFLASGKETNLGMLKGLPSAAAVARDNGKNDIRNSVISYMASGMKIPEWKP